MRIALTALALATLLAACGGKHASPVASTPPLLQQRIPNIDRMGLDELTQWLDRCKPYMASPEARARSPYDPVDCDEVSSRHLSWRTKSTQKPAPYLPAVH
jgi:hypothetical protein